MRNVVRTFRYHQSAVCCMHCEHYDPTSPYQDRPPCLDYGCHGFLSGCNCLRCKAKEQQQRERKTANPVQISV